MKKDYDLIIYGASGFTGSLVVEYLDNNYHDISWAIAGRNEEKLKKISNSTSSAFVSAITTGIKSVPANAPNVCANCIATRPSASNIAFIPSRLLPLKPVVCLTFSETIF